MWRISRVAAAALAMVSGVSSMAQVLTAPLPASAAVRLTDSCATGEDAGMTGASINGLGCFAPPPPPPVAAAAEFANPRNGDYRLPVGAAEAASLSVPASGACTGQYSGVAVYRVAFPRAPMAPTIYRFTSSKPLYDELLSQGWTGRGIAFCAMP